MSDAAHKPNHPYHLVDPSPWPVVGAIAAGLFTVGMVLYMHDLPVFGHKFGLGSIVPGVLGIFATMFLWWRDVVKEGEVQGHHSPVVQIGLRYGMALFIASEVMFFAAFFWAFFDSALFPREAIGHAWPGVWPAVGTEGSAPIHPLDPYAIPLLNTLILLTSGCTVTWAHHALKHNDRTGLIQGLALTVLLGIMFTSFQAFEYLHAPFGFKDGIYTSTFFMATGFHGFHVIIGTIFLLVCLVRAIKGHFKPDHHFGFEAAAWYWHFVDVVWLFLFSFVYIWGSGPGPYAG
jgi:cytochrome c oxidase subunit 3